MKCMQGVKLFFIKMWSVFVDGDWLIMAVLQVDVIFKAILLHWLIFGGKIFYPRVLGVFKSQWLMCDACAIQNIFAAVHVAALRRIYYVLRKSDQAKWL